MPHDPIPFAKVEALAKNIAELHDLERRRAAAQAQLIRWCVAALTQTTAEASRALEAQLIRDQRAGTRSMTSWVGYHEPSRKVHQDRDMALLQLQWLATQLENQSVTSRDNDLSEGDTLCASDQSTAPMPGS